MMRGLVLFLLGALIAPLSAHASTVLAYDLPASSPLLFEGFGISGDPLTRGSDLDGSNDLFGFAASKFTNASGPDGTRRFEFGFTSTVAYDLTALSFGIARTGKGPASGRVEAAIDGGAMQDISGDFTISTAGGLVTVDLSAFDAVTSASFFLYGFDGRGKGKKNAAAIQAGFVDSGDTGLLISGEQTPVPIPLPAGIVLLLSGVGLAVALRR